MRFEHRLRFTPGDASWLQWSKALVAELQACGLPLALQYRAELVLDELVSNWQQHGLGDGARSLSVTVLVEVQSQAAQTCVDIVCTDDGEPFDPDELGASGPASSLEQTPIGGLGWRLIRASCQDIAYRRTEGLNVLHLRLMPRPTDA